MNLEKSVRIAQKGIGHGAEEVASAMMDVIDNKLIGILVVAAFFASMANPPHHADSIPIKILDQNASKVGTTEVRGMTIPEQIMQEKKWVRLEKSLKI